jgi:hypothetical protein
VLPDAGAHFRRRQPASSAWRPPAPATSPACAIELCCCWPPPVSAVAHSSALDAEQVYFVGAGVDLVLHSQLVAERSVTVRRVASPAACPVRALKDWIDASDCRFGPVFRKVDRWGNVEHRRLGTDAIRRVLARRTRSFAAEPPHDACGPSALRRLPTPRLPGWPRRLELARLRLRQRARRVRTKLRRHKIRTVAPAFRMRILDVPATSPATGQDASVTQPAERAVAAYRTAPMQLAHTDWLHHRLAIIGETDQLAAFRRAAAGAGIIPWQIDLDRLEEDVFHLLAAPPPCWSSRIRSPCARTELRGPQ